jgi:hypothetical protein
MGCISNLLPITLSEGEGWVRQKRCVNLKCALQMIENQALAEAIFQI